MPLLDPKVRCGRSLAALLWSSVSHSLLIAAKAPGIFCRSLQSGYDNSGDRSCEALNGRKLWFPTSSWGLPDNVETGIIDRLDRLSDFAVWSVR
jgi:hypothetical protein